MSRATEVELAIWQAAGTELASTIRKHQAVNGYCPICRLRSGQPEPDPCDITVKDLYDLAGGKR